MSLLSDEVNFLVYRYLQESGYKHSAFSFALESHISQSNINGNLVPSGALISVIQKGIQFIEGELCINSDGSFIENLDALESLPLIDAVIPEVLAQRAETFYRLVSKKQEKVITPTKVEQQNQQNNNQEQHNQQQQQHNQQEHNHQEQQCSENNIDDADNCIVLQGHKSKVFTCSWHPSNKMVATGSADGTVGLWKLDSQQHKMLALEHNSTSNRHIKQATDITCITWHPNGHLLATAGSDFNVKIWDTEGREITILGDHKDLILSLKWNKSGSSLLSGGLDKKCIVWNTERFHKIAEYNNHTGPVVDTDWQSDSIFASCSTDKSICVYNTEESLPWKIFNGHIDVINCVKWDPSSSVLASCSDDKSIKLWDHRHEKPILSFTGHTKEVSVVKWASSKVLGSAGYDNSVRIWDIESKACLYTFAEHSMPVNTMTFHPSGRYVISAAHDGLINIWDLQTGELVVSTRGNSGIFEVQFNDDARFLSICQDDKTVKIYDTRSLFPS